MATYVPNANQTTEPAASQPVESAALEFRTLKTHAVQFNTTDAETSKTRLPADTVRAGKYLAFDSLGRPIAADSLPATLYLGAFDVAPVTRNSGEVLATGDLYFNTVDTRMWVYDIVAGWVNYELNTQTSATAAAASAGASATSASAALTSEQNADVSEASALAAKVAAESARDAANAVGKVFTTTALGIAGTIDGQSFSVLSADATELIVYTNNAGVAAELFRYKTAALIDALMNTTAYDRSNYSWGVIDSATRLAIGIKPDGTFDVGTVTDVGGKLSKLVTDLLLDSAGNYVAGALRDFTDRGTAVWAVTDANDRMALWVDKYGQAWTGNINITNMLLADFQTQIDTATARITVNEANITSNTNFACWGDSLTEGVGSTSASSKSYPAVLGSLYTPARASYRGGIGGQVSAQIATRAGAEAILMTLSGNAIPASGAVAVTVTTSSFLYTAATTTARTVYGWIAGIYGALTKDTSNAYSFTRSAAGSVVPVTPETVFTLDNSDYAQRTTLIWTGTNDGIVDSTDTKAYIASMVASLTPLKKRFVILSLPGNSSYTIGTAGYIYLTALNRDLKLLYPANYFDVKFAMQQAYDPGTPQDVTDLANDIVPSTLRSDATHFNDAGYLVLATALKSFLDSKGW